MALPPGTRIGSYEVLSSLGAGGMGEVYRAKDSKLKREVALKVLPADVANDRERMARFQREAEVLASLNHPHIAQIYGLEENALVMELVEGEDLAERLKRGAIPIDEALPIAKQIAEALEAAHEQGIIHRDLKPANIKVRPDGTVKVLDFGLAKALDPGVGIRESGVGNTLANSPTITSPAMSLHGMILGTAAYMSPEQARGKAVDKRADIWAFGCVLFEMLTGTRAFKGDDVTDIITSVMRDTPGWSTLPAETPAAIRTLLRRSIEKDPRKRVPHVAVARLELEDAMLATGELVGPATGALPAPRRANWTLTLGVGTAVAAALTLLVTRTNPAPIDLAPTLRFTLGLPAGVSVTRSSPAVSPDGRFVAISARDGAGNTQVWLRAFDGDAFAPVPGTTGGILPFWSPDSTELGFFLNGRLMRTAVPGGTPREIANTELVANTLQVRGSGTPAAWGGDDSILFGAGDGIYRVAASGGTIARVTDNVGPGDGTTATFYSWPQWMPDQAGFFYTTQFDRNALGALWYRPASGPEPVQLSPLSRAQYTRQGLLVAQSTSTDSGTISLHPFEPARGTLGEAATVLAGDATRYFSASENGTLVYRRGGRTSYAFEWVDNQGRPTGDSFEVSGAGAFNLSRDGSLLAYMEDGIMLRDMARGVATRLVPASGGFEPLLSADGQRVAYSVSGSEPRIALMPSAGGAAEVVYEGKGAIAAEDWSSDGRFLVANEDSKRGLIISLDKQQPPTVYADLPTGSSLDESRFSPDGKWLTYNAVDRGHQEVYLVPLPPTGERWQLSVTGGSQGRWRRDGRAVYYLAPDGDLMTLELQATPGGRPRIGRPQKLFATELVVTSAVDQFAVSGDGSRFLLRRPKTTTGAEELNVIVNWPGLLRAKP